MVSFTPRPLYPQRKSPWYPLDRRLGGPQRRSNNNQSEEWLQPCLFVTVAWKEKTRSIYIPTNWKAGDMGCTYRIAQDSNQWQALLIVLKLRVPLFTKKKSRVALMWHSYPTTLHSTVHSDVKYPNKQIIYNCHSFPLLQNELFPNHSRSTLHMYCYEIALPCLVNAWISSFGNCIPWNFFHTKIPTH